MASSEKPLRDRREEFSTVPWQQGRLLLTRTVCKMPALWQQNMEKLESRCAFAHFSSLDEGRSRVFLYEFPTTEACLQAVKQHNLGLEKT